MRFRPCIDLHEGKVKQIVGGTLSDTDAEGTTVNFESALGPAHYAEMYWADGLSGGHVIMLGPGNERAAEEALSAHPGALQVGGGVTPENADCWLRAGASHVIVTSYLFDQGRFRPERLRRMRDAVGKERLVVDLSCRRRGDSYVVACNRWQTLTRLELSAAVLEELAESCAEFLVHGVDVEGRQQGVEDVLVGQLGRWSPIPVTYAGGIRNLDDIRTIERLGRSRVDFTVGSALDIFGGGALVYADLVRRFGRDRGGPDG